MDLGLVPDDDLFEELARRSEIGCVTLLREPGKNVKGYTVIRHWWGNRHTLLGLLAHASRVVADQLEEELERERADDNEGDGT